MDWRGNEDAGDLTAFLEAERGVAELEHWLEKRARDFDAYKRLWAKWKAHAKPEDAHVYEGEPSCENCEEPFTEENCVESRYGWFCPNCAAEHGHDVPEHAPGFKGWDAITLPTASWGGNGYEDFHADG